MTRTVRVEIVKNGNMDSTQLLDMYGAMLRIRIFEERAGDLVQGGEIKTPCHLYIGQEAVAVGVCSALKKDDYIWGAHRSHGHYLAKSGNLEAMMCEILGKASGCARGRGGSMHLAAPHMGICGTVPIVAGTIPLGVGAALASKLRGDDRVSVCFLGDGATEEGHFHESLNMAALYGLPVIFVCENNLYSSHLHILERRPKDNIYEIAALYGFPGIRVDGNDVLAVYQATGEAVERARQRQGPSLLECRTYRWRGHVGPSWDWDVGVKRRDELHEWMARCPIARARNRLKEMQISDDELDALERQIRSEVEQAIEAARQAPYPNQSELSDLVFCEAGFTSDEDRRLAAGEMPARFHSSFLIEDLKPENENGKLRCVTYADAIREAFAQLLASDPRVFVIGQGLWSPWYVGSSMTDLDNDFGKERIIDTPVCENATTGAAIGAAVVGMRPIVVHPRMDFMLLAMDPLVNQAANWCYMFGGQTNVPLVIRPIINRGGEQGAQHSQALQAFFMHVPGIKVVMPSTAYDAKGLLIAAVRDGNPVMYIDDRWLYKETGHVPRDMYEVTIGSAAVRCSGSDLTIVAYSYMAVQSVKASSILHEQGIFPEVIDLRSIKPWDHELVCESVRRTGRLVVVDATWGTGGVAAEIAATVTASTFDALKAPPVRVTLPDSPAPTSKRLEEAYYPNCSTIAEAARIALGQKKECDVKDLTTSVPGRIIVPADTRAHVSARAKASAPHPT